MSLLKTIKNRFDTSLCERCHKNPKGTLRFCACEEEGRKSYCMSAYGYIPPRNGSDACSGLSLVCKGCWDAMSLFERVEMVTNFMRKYWSVDKAKFFPDALQSILDNNFRAANPPRQGNCPSPGSERTSPAA